VGLNDVEVAIAAASAGADILRSRYGTTLERFKKSSSDFATDVDIEVEVAIFDYLRNERPGDELVGEESGDARKCHSGRSWLVDPLCGTLNFASHTPLFSVNVALKDAEATLAAVAVDPMSGEVMWTNGNRSFLRNGDVDVAMHPTSDSSLVDINVDGPHPNAPLFHAVDMLSEPEFVRYFAPRLSSTSLALAWVAVGKRVGYVSDSNTPDSVHFSSGIALCQSAGCIVTNLRGGELYTGVGGIVAASDATAHSRLIAIIEELFLNSRRPHS